MHRFGEQTCGRWYLHREGQCNGRPRADRFRGGTGTPLSCQHAGKAWAVTGGCDSFQRLRGSRGPPLRSNGGRLRIDDGESDVLEILFFFIFCRLMLVLLVLLLLLLFSVATVAARVSWSCLVSVSMLDPVL